MDQAHPAVGDGERDAGADQLSLPRREGAVLGSGQVGAGVPVVGVARQRHRRIKPLQCHHELVCGHRGILSRSSVSAAASSSGRRVEISQYGCGSAGSAIATSTLVGM